VALARALSGDVLILLAEEPTQGIDVRSRAEIHALLRKIAREHHPQHLSFSLSMDFYGGFVFRFIYAIEAFQVSSQRIKVRESKASSQAKSMA
jgi:ABC-type phosphate/phosphonate transport system ATPase subunit